MHDFANDHQPVSGLFSRDSAAAIRLTEQQLADFEQNGFVTGPSVLNAEQIEALRAELTELTAPNHDGRELWYE